MYFTILICERCGREFSYRSRSPYFRKYCGPYCRYNRQAKDKGKPDPQSQVPNP